MIRTKAVLVRLYAAALSLWLIPTLALAQATTQPGSAPAPAPMAPDNAARGGGSSLLWIIAALVVLAIIWWAMSSRRRHQTPMTR